MLFAFKRSKIAAAVVLAITLVLNFFIWVRDQGRETYIPIVASVLMAALGVLVAALLGNILASMENTRYLGYLHMELDPEKFLNAYREVPGRLKAGSRHAAVARSYLADGYWADGQFDKALDALGEMPSANDSALFGLFAAKRCAILQAKGDVKGAEEALGQLGAAVDGCRRSKPELSQNLKEQLTLYRQQQNALTGQPVDRAALSRVFKQAQYHLRRLEVSRVFQLDEKNNGSPAPHTTADYLREHSGKTFFARGV